MEGENPHALCQKRVITLANSPYINLLNSVYLDTKSRFVLLDTHKSMHRRGYRELSFGGFEEALLHLPTTYVENPPPTLQGSKWRRHVFINELRLAA